LDLKVAIFVGSCHQRRRNWRGRRELCDSLLLKLCWSKAWNGAMEMSGCAKVGGWRE